MRAETIEQRIRVKAYTLWQEDGRMEGCADEYWRKAKILVEAEIADEFQWSIIDDPLANGEACNSPPITPD